MSDNNDFKSKDKEKEKDIRTSNIVAAKGIHVILFILIIFIY